MSTKILVPLVISAILSCTVLGNQPGISNLIQITNSATIDVFPQISHGGDELLIQSANAGALDNWDIWRIDKLGRSGRLWITDDPNADFSPTWTPDDKKVLYCSDKGKRWNIWVKDIDGNNGIYLFRRSMNFGEREVDISPQGDKIVFSSGFTSDGDLMNRNVWNSAVIFRFPGPPYIKPSGTPSPNARFVEGNWPDIWIANIDGSNQRHLVDRGLNPAWSPDGEYIAFASEVSGNWDIWTIRIDGTELRQITGSPDDEYYPCWSPGGEWIAYTQSKREQIEVEPCSDNRSCCLFSFLGFGDGNDCGKNGEVEEVNRPADIWVIKKDGSEDYQITSSLHYWDEAPSWGRVEVDGEVKDLVYFHSTRPHGMAGSASSTAGQYLYVPTALTESPAFVKDHPLNIWAVELKSGFLKDSDNKYSYVPPPNIQQKKTTVSTVGFESVTIEVLNSTTVTGLAKSLYNKLRSAGFNAIGYGNSRYRNLEHTKIFYKPGTKEYAIRLARYLSGTQYIYPDNNGYKADLTIILGRNDYSDTSCNE